jgi:uncharacterized protein YrrD
VHATLGTRVRTSDGEDVGVVDKLIFDPETDRVKAVAIRRGFILRRDVEVPIDDLVAAPNGRELRLTCTADHSKDLPPFDESKYTTPPVDYTTPAGIPSTGLLWPAGYPGDIAPVTVEQGVDPHVRAEIASALHQLDFENAVVGAGSAVKSRDGEQVGDVHRIVFEPETGRVRFLVVRCGFLFREDVELPASTIASIGDGVVYLTTTRARSADPGRSIDPKQ